MKLKNFRLYTLTTVALLTVPFIAMQFSDEVNWDLLDFVVMACLLLGAAAFYEIISARISKKHRIYAAITVIMIVIIIWAEMAVGVFGSPISGS